MKKIIAALFIVLLIIIAFFAAYMISRGTTGMEDWGDGEIQQKYLALYADGTTGEITTQAPLFQFKIADDNQDIQQITYQLAVKLPISTIIDLTGYKLDFHVYRNNTALYNYTHTLDTPSLIKTTNESEWTLLLDEHICPCHIIPLSLGVGDYRVVAYPSGTLKTSDSGIWYNAPLPSPLEFSLRQTAENDINLIFVNYESDIDLE